MGRNEWIVMSSQQVLVSGSSITRVRIRNTRTLQEVTEDIADPNSPRARAYVDIERNREVFDPTHLPLS